MKPDQEKQSLPTHIFKDPNRERGIDITYVDLRPSAEIPRDNTSVLAMLDEPVDCLELPFIDEDGQPILKQDGQPKLLKITFFDNSDLDDKLNNIRMGIQMRSKRGQFIDCSAGRLVRYEFQDGVELGILPEVELVEIKEKNPDSFRKLRPVFVDFEQVRQQDEARLGRPLTKHEEEIMAEADAISIDALACGRTVAETVNNIEMYGGKVSGAVKSILGLTPPVN